MSTIHPGRRKIRKTRLPHDDELQTFAERFVAMEVVHPGRSWKVVAATFATPARSRRMDVHQNAKTTPHGRRLMIKRLAEGWTVAGVAAAAGVTAKTVGKWQGRHAQEGEAGLAAARRGHMPARAGCRTPSWPRSWRSTASACPDPPSPAGSAARSRPWAWSCATTGSHGSTSSTPSPRSSAISATGPAS